MDFEIHNGDTVNERLLPCPFCGEKPVWYLKGSAEGIGKRRVITVKCPCCGTIQETAILKLPTKMGCIMAESKWNLRTTKED
jgi:uncharacterized Zn finger protein